MKSIVISINPQHALNILNGNKTLELRKSVPKDFVGWVYGYVTKKKPNIMIDDYTINYPLAKFHKDYNGTIPFRFWFDEYLNVVQSRNVYGNYLNDITVYDNAGWLNESKKALNNLCLTVDEVIDYGKGKDLYAWRIKKLEIFDKPMQLSEFYKDFEDVDIEFSRNVGTHEMGINPLTRPPQSWQYVWKP